MFSLTKMHLKMSAKWRPFYLGLIVSTTIKCLYLCAFAVSNACDANAHICEMRACARISIEEYNMHNITTVNVCMYINNSHIWQWLPLRDWRWKAAVTLGWMGVTFSGSGSWPPHNTASASTGPLSDLPYKIFSWWAGIPVHWMRHSEYQAFIPCERHHSLGVTNGLYFVLNNILKIYVKLLFQWYKMYYEQRPGIAVL